MRDHSKTAVDNEVISEARMACLALAPRVGRRVLAMSRYSPTSAFLAPTFITREKFADLRRGFLAHPHHLDDSIDLKFITTVIFLAAM